MSMPINGNYDAWLLQQQQLNGVNGAQATGVQGTDAEAAAVDTGIGLEGSGDAQATDIAAAEGEYAAAAEALEGTPKVATTEEGQKILDEIEDLEEERDDNYEKMEKIEAHIEDLTEQAEANIMKAAKQQEAAVEEHEEETQKAVDEQLNAYVAANKEGGEGMTREELQKNVKGALGHIPEVGEAVSALLEANDQINEIDSCLGELNNLITDTQDIEQQIELKNQEFEAVESAAQQPPASSGSGSGSEDGDCPPQPCEPQGFQDNQGNQYDFFIDKDQNGTLSNESEFLGYEGGKQGQEAAWAEMTQLDTSGDGIVDASELAAGGVMVYKTDANGNQTAMTIEEAFGEDSDLAINTQQHETAKQGVGPNNFNTGTGSENNELWGTFDVTLNGENLNGYQTNDDINWLKENYNFSDYANENGLTSGEAGEQVESEDAQEAVSAELQQHIDFFNTYSQKVQELKEMLMQGWENQGLTESSLESISETATQESKDKAANFFKSLELTDEENEDVTGAESTEEITGDATTDLSTDMTTAEMDAELEKDLELFAA
ncbi:hypothetical protein IJD15_07285 [bacterium]|nr:hypothetical protein [bacterium]